MLLQMQSALTNVKCAIVPVIVPKKLALYGLIIKALECCVKGLECKNCPANPHKGNYGYCTSLLLKAALDLINRQKAEIERLEKDSKRLKKVEMQLDDAMKMYDTIKAEAYKEFADRLKENSIATFSWNGVVLVEEIDNLLKEMERDNDE